MRGPGRGRIQVAPSTYYARSKTPLSDAELNDAYLANQLRSLWQDNWGVYGVRKLWHAARRAGQDIGRDQVARLMKIAQITGTVRGRHRTTTTRRDETAARHPDLVKRGWRAPTGIDQLWVADFSYVWTLAGFCYLTFVVDVFSRRILVWRVTTTTKHTAMVTDALRQALQVRRRGEHAWVAAGLIHHVGSNRVRAVTRPPGPQLKRNRPFTLITADQLLHPYTGRPRSRGPPRVSIGLQPRQR